MRPPRPLPEDFHALCPRFSLLEAEGAAADFELPEMVQATFYVMLLNDAEGSAAPAAGRRSGGPWSLRRSGREL